MHRNTVFIILSILVVAGLVWGVSRGSVPEAVAGWLLEKQGVGYRNNKRSRRRAWGLCEKIKPGYWATRSKSWHIPLVRSLFLWLLWEMSGRIGSDWLNLLPWMIWFLPEKSSKWGWLSECLWQIQRVLLVGYAGLNLYHLLGGSSSVMVGCVMGIDEKPWVGVERTEDGDWQATLSGHFTLRVSGDHPFRLRLLLIFLGLLQSDNDQRKSRRTRDGRTPFVRQEQMAAWTNTKQEHISLWMKSWQKGDWANLLSLKTAEVLTAELVEQIVTVLATFPNWTIEQVY